MNKLVVFETISNEKIALYRHGIVGFGEDEARKNVCFIYTTDKEFFTVKGTFGEILGKLEAP